MTTINLGKIKPLYKGTYSAGVTYRPLDFVLYNTALYICKQQATGVLPTATAYFDPVVPSAAEGITNTPAGTITAVTVQAALNQLDSSKAPKGSPTFTGAPRTPIQAPTDDSTQVVNSSWVRTAMGNIASAAGFVFYMAAQGYIKFPSWLGGWVVQWGEGAANAANGEAGTTLPFPLAWPNACWRMVSSDGGLAVSSTSVSVTSTSTYRLWVRDVRYAGAPYVSFGVQWIAVGH